MTNGADNPNEDSSGEFEGLHDRLTAEPVSIDQADARVDALLEKHLEGKTGNLQYVIDNTLPPETVIKVVGTNIFLSPDAAESLQRHYKRIGKRPRFIKPRKTGEPYKGS